MIDSSHQRLTYLVTSFFLMDTLKSSTFLRKSLILLFRTLVVALGCAAGVAERLPCSLLSLVETVMTSQRLDGRLPAVVTSLSQRLLARGVVDALAMRIFVALVGRLAAAVFETSAPFARTPFDVWLSSGFMSFPVALLSLCPFMTTVFLAASP